MKLLMLLLALNLLVACTSEQAYNSGQAWQADSASQCRQQRTRTLRHSAAHYLRRLQVAKISPAGVELLRPVTIYAQA